MGATKNPSQVLVHLSTADISVAEVGLDFHHFVSASSSRMNDLLSNDLTDC
jgi:hypothetical protein